VWKQCSAGNCAAKARRRRRVLCRCAVLAFPDVRKKSAYVRSTRVQALVRYAEHDPNTRKAPSGCSCAVRGGNGTALARGVCVRLPGMQYAACARGMMCAVCHVEMLPWQHHVCRMDLRGSCAVCVRCADGHVLAIMFASEVPIDGCGQLQGACGRTGASGAGRGAQRTESPWHGHAESLEVTVL